MLDSLIAFINKYITRNGNNEITGPVLNDVLIRIANILGSKVDKVEGKGLSTQDYTTADRNKLNGVEDGAQVNIINGVEVNGSALTPTPEGIIDIEIPVNVSELDNDKNYQTREDVELSVVGAKFNLADGIITFTRMNGTTFIIDLPTEMIVKSGYYDGTTSEIVLVLADDTEIRVPVSKLVNEYYGDDSTIELYSDSNDGYKFKFKISEAYRRKIDGAEQTANMVKTISESATDVQYPSAKAVWNSVKGLATNVQAFTQAGTRDEIKSGETISVIFGKIKKWLADLKAVAFSGSYNDLSNRPEIGNGTITITQNGAAKGSFTTNQTGNTTIDLSDENTTYGIGNASTAGLVKSDSSNVEIRNDGKMIARRADLADYAKYGVRGFNASKANSAIKYALFGVVGLPLSGENDLYFSCTIEVQGAAAGSPLLGKYNVFIHAKGDTTYSGQIGCVYTSNGVSDIIIGEVVRSGANSQGMLYLWANVSHLTTTQEAYNVSVHGDINNDLEVRQNVHTTSIPYYSGVLLNPELCNTITISNITGLQSELNTKVTKIPLPTTANTSAVYVKIATVKLTSASNRTAQAIISGTGAIGGIVKDVAIVSICGRTTNGTEHIRLLKLDKASYSWTIECGYVKGNDSIDFYLQLGIYNGNSSLIPISEDGASFDTIFTATTTKPSGWVDGSVGSVYSDFNKPTFDITSEGTYDVTDNTFIVTSRTDGLATNKTIYRRPATFFWNYIKDKISSVLGLTATNYNGIASKATADESGNNIQDGYTQKINVGSNDAADAGWILLCEMTGISYAQMIVYPYNVFNLAIEEPMFISAMSSGYSINMIILNDFNNLVKVCKIENGLFRIYVNGAENLRYRGSFFSRYSRVTLGTSEQVAIPTLPGNEVEVEREYYRKLSGCLELTDSNLATYFNSSTGVLTIPNGVTTVLFNTSSTKKVSNIVGGCAVNGYRLTIAGRWLPVQKTSSSTTGCFSSYIYGYRAGASGTSFDGASNRLTEAFEDFIYFKGVWYSKAY